VSLAFRIGGRILKRFANVGDRVVPEEILATLDPVDEQNALRSATAALSAAEGQLVEATANLRSASPSPCVTAAIFWRSAAM
jgi:multidrug efflux pump subunit AcrA (membrane-fusion protein)